MKFKRRARFASRTTRSSLFCRKNADALLSGSLERHSTHGILSPDEAGDSKTEQVRIAA